MKEVISQTTYEEDILSSRFIALVYPLRDASEVKDIITNVKKEYKKATHYVYAYRLGETSKSNDDGEPSGTAGRPILELLHKKEINNTLIIVVRYYGGSKLGAGRLLRTYVSTANEALNKAEYKEI
ncbi:MAG: YigZ family protein [Coprobacillus sp.]|nr:YigZ family protein [Coprobacillus sp.]